MATIKQLENLEHAYSELETAYAAIAEMRSTKDLKVLDRRRSDFLHSWNLSYNFLIKASNRGNTRKISDIMISDRKSDEIIQYVFQARDSKTHVHVVTKKTPNRMEVLGSGGVMIETGTLNGQVNIQGNAEVHPDGSIGNLTDVSGYFSDGEFHGSVSDEKNVKFRNAQIILAEVRNRSGNYHPPFESLEADEQIKQTAAHCLRYLDEKYAIVESELDDQQ